MTARGCVVVAVALLASAGSLRAQCEGDFNDDGAVTIDELVTALENALSGCDIGAQRFVDNRDGTISDRRRGLMWEKKVGLDGLADDDNLHDADNKYQWAGLCTPSDTETFCQPTRAALAACPSGAAGCVLCPAGQTCDRQPSARPTVFEWVAALNAAAFAGHSDWRIPTLDEIESLADRDTAAPAADPAFAGDACAGDCADLADAGCSCTASFFYWSVTPVLSARPRVWTVRFDIGAVDGGALDFDVLVRAVRTAR